jgi:ribonuclease Z
MRKSMHIKLATTALLLLIFSLPVAAQDFKVTLLGTGDPIPRLDRFGPATLVEVGGQELLFDVGRGASLTTGADEHRSQCP